MFLFYYREKTYLYHYLAVWLISVFVSFVLLKIKSFRFLLHAIYTSEENKIIDNVESQNALLEESEKVEKAAQEYF